ncbi:SKI family transcriptional corepressor 1-like [Lineus longissimus]|uniref:SKI family transcriptional corepressor 1-like n=1 Tax=Lineus longissimus TaxID=88925 RepID=UPI002B4F2B89
MIFDERRCNAGLSVIGVIPSSKFANIDKEMDLPGEKAEADVKSAPDPIKLTPEQRREREEYPTMKNGVRQNTVGRVLLHGVQIISLVIDNVERLCLAQISTTLLKQYSYNEIHNRRVALGITCVQCTPVQLEILRRAGAMPISSRRCGMITKREAERLVKSFLEDITPPKLPEDFAFTVEHNCGWGCDGKFVPSRYNSSRAKCIKCNYCNMFFSPNKFIFHYHRTPESKYSHPDAANFNSWRRHLTLKAEHENDDNLQHVWEDVKAMFNGGSRKRVLSSFTSKSERSRSSHGVDTQYQKKQKVSHSPTRPNSQPVLNAGQFGYPVYQTQSASYPMKCISPHPTYLTYPYNKPLSTAEVKGNVASWPTTTEAPYTSYDLFWSKHLQTPSEQEKFLYGVQRGLQEQQKDPVSQRSPERHYIPLDCRKTSLFTNENTESRMHPYISAFKPVGKKASSPIVNSKSPASDLDNAGSITQSETSECNDVDNENFEIDIMDDSPSEETQNNNRERLKNIECDMYRDKTPGSDFPYEQDEKNSRDSPLPEVVSCHGVDISHPATNEGDAMVIVTTPQDDASCQKYKMIEKEITEVEDVRETDNSAVQSDKDDADTYLNKSKDEILKELCRQVKTRRDLEKECKLIQESFQQQVKRESSYREQMAKQLQLVRENLCHELDQERKARYSLQQKLKEAHDALHNFSCKMLASRQCAECSFKDQLLPR